MSSSNYCFLTCIQVSQEAGQVVWYSHLFQNFPQLIVIHTVEGFGVVNKAEIDVFLELSCFFNDPVDIGNLISGSSGFSKTSRKFSVHILLKPGLENFEHYFTSMWDECNCAIVWAFFGIAFLRDWNECEAARVNTMTGGPDLSFGFPWNGKIPHPHQAAWSQPINRCPKGNISRESRKARQRLILNKSLRKFVPIKLLCKHVTNPPKPATNCLCSPYKFM